MNACANHEQHRSRKRSERDDEPGCLRHMNWIDESKNTRLLAQLEIGGQWGFGFPQSPQASESAGRPAGLVSIRVGKGGEG